MIQNSEIFVGSRIKIFPQQIIYLKGYINYTEIFYANGKKELISITLKTFETCFKSYGFCRIHKSAIVNTAFIDSYTFTIGGGEIGLTNHETMRVSRRRNREMKDILLSAIKSSLHHY
jgi:two-component system, LytTR family, response regulator